MGKYGASAGRCTTTGGGRINGGGGTMTTTAEWSARAWEVPSDTNVKISTSLPSRLTRRGQMISPALLIFAGAIAITIGKGFTQQLPGKIANVDQR